MVDGLQYVAIICIFPLHLDVENQVQVQVDCVLGHIRGKHLLVEFC
jgi:hypothetical protein